MSKVFLSVALFLGGVLSAQTPAPVPTTTEPSSIYGACAGVHGISPAKVYGCYFTSQHIGTGTYTTEITDLVKMPDGTIGSSARVEITKRLATFGKFFLGVSAGGGLAEGNNGSATTALSARPLVGFDIPKTPLSIIGAAQLTSVAGSGQQANVSFAVTWSH